MFGPATSASIARARQHSVGDLLHRTARRYPDKLAVVAGDRRVTYREFDVAVNRAAHALADRGLAKGDRLALLSHNSWQFAVLAFATARLGVVLVPVNFMLGADEIAYILRHSGAAGMVAEDALAPTAEKALAVAGVDGGVRGLDLPVGRRRRPTGWEDVDDWWTDGPATRARRAGRRRRPAPADVHVGHRVAAEGRDAVSRSLIAQYVGCAIDGGMSADDVELHSLPMYHCAQLDCFFSVDVYLGATSIILPGPDPAAILATIARERVTKLFCPPTVWISLLRHPDFDTTDLSSLRKGYYGASAMPVEVLRELQRRLPDVRLWNFYGQTEMAPLATILRPDEQLPRAGSAGRAALNVETMLVDDDGNPVPPGTVGEIVHRSPHAALGYYNDEEKTAEAFAGGWFHSGDLGVLTEDGYLSVVDRKKDMIKTGGENVASREIEEAIYAARRRRRGRRLRHQPPALDRGGDRGGGAEAGRLDHRRRRARAHARATLAGYKRPKYVVLADALPKNPSGKILKRELRAVHAELAAED